MPWGGAPKCPGCDRTVYPMDQTIAADRKPFHNKCIRCQMFGCGNELTARTLHKYEGYNICDRCHGNIYNNKEYGPGEGKETMDERRKREEDEAKEKDRLEKAKKEKRCLECDKKTLPDDCEELVPGSFYHKGCLKCSNCGKVPDEDSPLTMGARNTDDAFGSEQMDPFCKFCYAKKYKMSAIKIQEIVTIAPEMSIGL